jgi:hypothetical protein
LLERCNLAIGTVKLLAEGEKTLVDEVLGERRDSLLIGDGVVVVGVDDAVDRFRYFLLCIQLYRR